MTNDLMPYTLRPTTAADHDFLFDLHAQAMREMITTIWGWDEAWQWEYFTSRFDPSTRQIIRVQEQDVGVLILEERETELYIALLEILPAFQNQGIGTAVLQDIITTVQGHNQPLSLHVFKINESAFRLYQRLGFKIFENSELRYKMVYFS